MVKKYLIRTDHLINFNGAAGVVAKEEEFSAFGPGGYQLHTFVMNETTVITVWERRSWLRRLLRL